MIKKKIIKKLLAASLAVGSLTCIPEIYHFPQISSVAYAEVKEYIGVGEYIMSSKETPEDAINNAKIYAERDASEKAGVFVNSYTEVKNQIVNRDEIETFTSGILKIVSTNTEVIPLTGDAKGWIKYRVTVKTNIDTSNINELVNKYMSTRNAEFVADSSKFQKIIDEQREKISQLEKDLNSKDKKQIKEDFDQIIKLSAYRTKLSEGIIAGENDKVRIFTEAININPIGAEAYYWRAMSLDGKQAIQDFSRAIAIDPSYTDAYYFRGNIYNTSEEQELAVEDYTKIIEIGSKKRKIDAYESRASCYYELNEYKKAIEDYTKVIEMAPNKNLTYVSRALCYKEIGDYIHAIEDYTNYFKIVNPNNVKNPQISIYYKLRGQCYQALGETEKANADFKMSE